MGVECEGSEGRDIFVACRRGELSSVSRHRLKKHVSVKRGENEVRFDGSDADFGAGWRGDSGHWERGLLSAAQ